MKIELKIISFLAGGKDKKYTMNEIAKAIREYYSFVHRTINRLAEDDVVLKMKAGKAYLCSLNLENEKTITMMQLSEIEKKLEFYEKNKELKLILEDFINSAKSQFRILSIVLFGSYSKGKATKESDIDVLILSKNSLNIGKIIKETYAKYGKEINPIMMTPNDFKKQKDKALNREIISNHHVLYGAEAFVKLVLQNES